MADFFLKDMHSGLTQVTAESTCSHLDVFFYLTVHIPFHAVLVIITLSLVIILEEDLMIWSQVHCYHKLDMTVLEDVLTDDVWSKVLHLIMSMTLLSVLSLLSIKVY